jgi:putative phosphonate metabolism protein
MDQIEAQPRYAIYYAPERGSALAGFGDSWLGRSAETGPAPRLPVPGVPRAVLDAATREPARYGFHATLKPPFRLAPGVSPDQFLDRVGSFARTQAPVCAPPLELTAIASFLALAPESTSPDLYRLAANCVVFFDVFRRPPDDKELARRRAQGLTPRQEALLTRFGYPYVLEEYRFHLTLTGKVSDAALRERLFTALGRLVQPFRDQALEVRELCVFEQSGPEQDFALIRRFPLQGAG